METKKVSNSKIKVNITEDNKQNVKGSDWISEPYSNIFLLAKKKSGKTTIIENMLDRFAGKNTKFIFIVSTINKDQTWLNIVKKWENKGHDVLTYTDIYDDGENVLEQFIDLNKGPNDEDKSKVIEKVTTTTRNQSGGARRIETKTEIRILGKGPEKKKKLIYPEYIFVLDDLGSSMRDKSLNQFLKTNRHFKSKVIMSAQDITDLEPPAIKQLDYALVFGRLPEDKLEKLRSLLGLNISEDQFLKLYKDATSEPYQFLYIERTPSDESFRKGFNYQYEL
jgi:hypothetical protein